MCAPGQVSFWGEEPGTGYHRALRPCATLLTCPGSPGPVSPSVASAFAFDGAVVGAPLQRPLRNLSDTVHACLFAQLCPTLCNPMDCSTPGSSIYGTLQARTLEWVAMSFSRGSSRSRNRTQVSLIAGRLFTV